jgi:hypothetical protein
MITTIPCRADCDAAVCECRVLTQNLKVLLDFLKTKAGAAQTLVRMIEADEILALQFGDDNKGGGSVH